MTVKDLLKNVSIDPFSFEFNNQFDAYNALCDASKKIADIVGENLKNSELDWDDIFIDKVGFNYKTDYISRLYTKYDDIDKDILYSKLIIDAIYVDGRRLKLVVHYEE